MSRSSSALSGCLPATSGLAAEFHPHPNLAGSALRPLLCLRCRCRFGLGFCLCLWFRFWLWGRASRDLLAKAGQARLLEVGLPEPRHVLVPRQPPLLAGAPGVL